MLLRRRTFVSSPSIPHLNTNNFICFQRLTRRDAKQSICLTQTKQRVRFLTTDRRELSVFESPADVVRSIAVVCEASRQLRRNLSQIEVHCAHHSQNRRPDEL